jgi:hypothetical protein
MSNPLIRGRSWVRLPPALLAHQTFKELTMKKIAFNRAIGKQQRKSDLAQLAALRRKYPDA